MKTKESDYFFWMVDSLPDSHRFYVESDRQSYLDFLRKLYSLDTDRVLKHMDSDIFILTENDIQVIKEVYHIEKPLPYYQFLSMFFSVAELKPKIKVLFDYLEEDL